MKAGRAEQLEPQRGPVGPSAGTALSEPEVNSEDFKDFEGILIQTLISFLAGN